MKLGQHKKQQIYDCASEAVMHARIEIARILNGHPDGVRVDEILSKAQHNAGDYAIRACEADYRTHPTHRHVLENDQREGLATGADLRNTTDE